MSFTLHTYDRQYLEGMTTLYNAESAFEPHIAPLDPERFVALVEQKSYFDPAGLQVAVERGEVVGWVLLPHVADRLGAPALNIWSLGVRDTHRRQGIGAALVARALARGYALGARFASVGTRLWNAPAHATYRKLGFAPRHVLVGRTRAG